MEIRECDSCGYETACIRYRRPPHIEFEWKQGLDKGQITQEEYEDNAYKWLCDLCASTLTGTAYDHPTSYDHPMMATVCYVGNAILAALKGGAE